MKLVKESIQFKREEDPLKALGIGSIKFIKKWLEKYDITDYTINDDLSINVNGSVTLENKNLKELPEYIKFNNIDGWFDISNNMLTSLRGCPKFVSTSFFCTENLLKTLEGCPKKVGTSFWCGDNKIIFTQEYIKSLCNVGMFIYTD